ncbi:NAD(P)H-binding protein [Streptomyces sp. A7024]|uniref:NAD(P)H-binding protein n=1 Tax=Streptomyces coryli TaxID=1128680 RepID=A0A6G4U6L9_9ACTN|nr:NAD(P)H-binding protein [Streptomyces coryli]NGN67380.1 NAD(P)H-binding protein [Streptomyces coryli]
MTFLVTGATGSVGRKVVEELVQGGHPVRALTRDPGKARLPEGVEVVAGDLTRPETLEGVFDGVTAAHFIGFAGDDYGPLETAAEIVDLAVRTGVRRATVLKGVQGEQVEEALQKTDLEWTFVQPVEFMSNARDWAESIRTERTVREPFPKALSAMVHEADIAAVITAGLTGDGHHGQTYVVTGPEALTKPDKVRILAEVTGQDIAYVELTEQQARDRWAAEGYPKETIDFFVWVHGDPPAIGYTVVDTVRQVTGRPARTFAEWVAEHRAEFTA